VPRVAPQTSAWVLEWLELEPIGGQANGAPVRQQQLAIGGHEVRHVMPLPHVSVQP